MELLAHVNMLHLRFTSDFGDVGAELGKLLVLFFKCKGEFGMAFRYDVLKCCEFVPGHENVHHLHAEAGRYNIGER